MGKTYVVGDIHGCFDELQKMISVIDFSSEDKLFLVGDYIDRGPKSIEVLEWLENCPENIFPIKGNHDVEFQKYMEIMLAVDKQEDLQTDLFRKDDSIALYETTKYLLKRRGDTLGQYFDTYGTVYNLVKNKRIPLDGLIKWAEMISQYPYYYRFNLRDRECVVVHAGYKESDKPLDEENLEFYLYAREEALKSGGIEHGVIVSGHNPTVYKDYQFYNDGKVFYLYDEEKDCIFYDIDCGCAYRSMSANARLACICLDDEKVFYV